MTDCKTIKCEECDQNYCVCEERRNKQETQTQWLAKVNQELATIKAKENEELK